MDLTRLKESARLELRRRCLSSLFNFCIAVMGYDDLTEGLHKGVCRFLEEPDRWKQLTLPRGFVKTWIGSIAFSVWVTLPRERGDEFPEGIGMDDKFYGLGQNARILIVSNVVANAHKIINLIRKIYERNRSLQALFPEVIPPNFNKVKWSDSEACISRSEDYTESTFEAGSIGGSTVSRHYDLIIEDDIIYAKKDDLTGKELQPNQDDIDKAIGWHKLASSLLVPGPHTRIHNIGTRWARHDVVDHIRTHEKQYKVLDISATDDGTIDGKPTWPEQYGREVLDRIRSSQGPYMFATQYLNRPMAIEDMLFKPEWLQYYVGQGELPESMRVFTTVDLAGWNESKRKNYGSRAVIITCGWCDRNHMWVLGYDVGRFNPSEVIDIIYKHNRIYEPEKIGVETDYYQKALLHFLRKEMENRGWLHMAPLRTESSVSKDLRIRALQPIASNMAIHCRPEHKDFIDEFCNYVPNDRSVRNDMLDAAAYQLQIARPGEPRAIVRKGKEEYVFRADMDKFLKWAMEGKKGKGFLDQYMPEESGDNFTNEDLEPVADWA